MRKRSLDLALAGGFFCIMLVFLFTAITYADCVTPIGNGDICVKNPGTGEVLVSGDVFFVDLDILPTAPKFATQYRLYRCCCLGTCTPSCTNQKWGEGIITVQMCDPNASRFSYKLGTPHSGCPELYVWEVPFVPEAGATCKLGVALLDKNVNPLVTFGHVIDKDIGGEFKINPIGSPVSALDLSPVSATVGPGGPNQLPISEAEYEISGGVPPFTIAAYTGSLPPGPIIYNYITINGKHDTQTFFGPVKFKVRNLVSAPCPDPTVTIEVRDSAYPASTATSSYVINCP